MAATFLSSSSSFLSLPAPPLPPTPEGLSVRLQFRTWNADGLLLSAQLAPEPQRLVLQISSGRLHLTHRTSALKTSEVSTGKTDGKQGALQSSSELQR